MSSFISSRRSSSFPSSSSIKASKIVLNHHPGSFYRNCPTTGPDAEVNRKKLIDSKTSNDNRKGMIVEVVASTLQLREPWDN
jgi:hypothetical protein